MSDAEDDGYAPVVAYTTWDEDEGDYDFYLCGECDEYLISDMAIWFDGKERPQTCPNCGRKLRW